MIKKNLKLLIITSIIILLPILVGVILWQFLPQQIPCHWNAAGEIDGWMSKAMYVFGFPGLMLAFQWICALGTAADPKKANHSDKIVHLVLWIIPVITVLLNAVTYATVFGKDVRMEVIIPIFMGLVFTILGNYLPKCKQSYTIGIKIPWTLNSEENWNKTHRFAGKLWLVCGLLIILTGFFSDAWYSFLAITLVMALAPVIYSYILHLKGI